MYRSALRTTPRIANAIRQSGAAAIKAGGRRFASSTANKPRSWKSSAVRWGLAIGAVYYYNTSNAFAEEPESKTIEPPAQFSDEDLPTVEAVVAQKRREAEARLQKTVSPATAPDTALLSESTSPAAPAQDVVAATEDNTDNNNNNSSQAPPAAVAEGSPEALEEEAGQQGAFNPETGEINWDCPCLGGMAHGPCGEEFKAAFSCFVYSKEEPKGMDCIDNFQHMQDCFRLHPEVYGEELNDDEEAEAQAPVEGAPEAAAAAEATPPEAAEKSNVSESKKPSGPTRDDKKSKEPAGSELPGEVKNKASSE